MPLTARQLGLLRDWLGEWSIVTDHSWPLQDTTVLRVRTTDGDLVVKASETSHHIGREIEAHVRVLNTLHDHRFPHLHHADREAGLLVTEWIPGTLVEGTRAEHNAAVYRQAGAALAQLHVRPETSEDYLPTTIAKIEILHATAGRLALLDPTALSATRQHLTGMRAHPVEVRFTHGDYQPRNWLDDHGTLRVIDFGRAAQRPVESDLIRLLHQQLAGAPILRDAFFAGYGHSLDKFDPDILNAEHLLQSVSTVVWAHQVGDQAFEDKGRAMVESFLSGEV